MRHIRVSENKFTLVDDEDFDWVQKHNWVITKAGYVGLSNGDGSFGVLLHRAILRAKSNEIVDHKDGNKLNNQKCNIRICTKSQNQMNRGVSKKKSIRYKGVYASGKKFTSYICMNGIVYYLGTFDNKIDAAKAYNDMATKLHGEFAKLNVI